MDCNDLVTSLGSTSNSGSLAVSTTSVVATTSKITDHKSPYKYNHGQKAWNIVRIMKMWHRDLQWVDALEKGTLEKDLLYAGWPQTFNL